MRLIDADEFIEKIIERPKDLRQLSTKAIGKALDECKTINPEDLRPKGEWKPYYEDVEIYNAGGFTERKQTGWICGKCKSKKKFHTVLSNQLLSQLRSKDGVDHE